VLANDVLFLAQVYTDLGQAYSQLGESARSLEMFQQALALIQPQSLQKAYKDLATYYQEQAEPVWAMLSHAKWLQADLQNQRPALKSQIQHALGRALLLSQPSEAYTYLYALVQEASARQDPLMLASASVHLAAWFLAHADFSQAEPFVRQALEQTDPFGESVIRADALILQGKLAYAQRIYDQGDPAFLAGLAMFEQLQIFEDVIEHSAFYARLLEERGQLHKAIIYWKKAYSYQRPRSFATE
jgi:tetratricopeptide (TPR) repeat protein